MDLLLIRNYNNKKYLWFLLFMLTSFFSILHACHSANQKNVENFFKKGIYIYKKSSHTNDFKGNLLKNNFFVFKVSK